MTDSYVNIFNDIKAIFYKTCKNYNNLNAKESDDYCKHIKELCVLPENVSQKRHDEFVSFDNNKKRDDLWKLLTEVYNANTLDSKSAYIDKKKLNSDVEFQDNILEESKVDLDNLMHLNQTNKRKIEINLNLYRQKELRLRLLKQVLIFVGILIIIPLLRFFKVFSRKTASILYSICLIVIALFYIVYYFKNLNRDDLQIKKYNFKKPSDNSVAESKALLNLSSRDKARCQALQELEDEINFDYSSIDVNIQADIDQSEENKNKCSIYSNNDGYD